VNSEKLKKQKENLHEMIKDKEIFIRKNKGLI